MYIGHVKSFLQHNTLTNKRREHYVGMFWCIFLRRSLQLASVICCFIILFYVE